MIYVSYSKKDAEVVRKICHSLELKGIKLVVDSNQLAGVDYAQELTRRIVSAEAVIFFYSESAENSTWVKHEIEFALSKGKRIIPVLLSKVEETGWFSFHLGTLNKIRFENDNIDECTNKILSIIHVKPNIPVLEEECQTYDEDHHHHNGASEGNNHKDRLPNASKLVTITLVSCCLILLFVLVYFSPNLESYNVDADLNIIDSMELLENDSIVIPYTTPSDSIILQDTIQNDSNMILYDDPPCGTECDEYISFVYRWYYIPLSFLAGACFLMLLIQIKKSKKNNLKLSCNIASKLSIDGDLQKEMQPREIYATHLEKGEYLIDFEDRENKERHQTFSHNVDSNECKLIFAKFQDDFLKAGKTIKCFIAGSKNLQRERDALRAVTCVMYNKWASKNFRILSYTFEDFERTAVVGGHQKLYNDFIVDEADWALFIINGQVGGITVEEYRMAMDAYKKNGRPKILALAKVGSEYNADVAAIKDEINKEHQYWTDYTDINSLKLLFESTLNWGLIDIFQS